MAVPFITYGGGFGAITGCVACLYFVRDARRQHAVYDQMDQMKDLRYITLFKQYKESRKKAWYALTMGPMAGAFSGLGLYGSKRATKEFLFAEAKTQRNVLLLFGVAMAALAGKRVHDRYEVK